MNQLKTNHLKLADAVNAAIEFTNNQTGGKKFNHGPANDKLNLIYSGHTFLGIRFFEIYKRWIDADTPVFQIRYLATEDQIKTFFFLN